MIFLPLFLLGVTWGAQERGDQARLHELRARVGASERQGPCWFHGRKARTCVFDLGFVGGASANDQEGPGFYFTTDMQEARSYAYPEGVVLTAELTPGRWLPDRLASKGEVERLMRASPCYREALEDWDEVPARAHAYALRGMMGPGHDTRTAFLNVWADFYHRCGEDAAYLRELVRLGYGGVVIPQPDTQFRAPNRQHAVMFDPSAIQNVRVVEDRGTGPVSGRMDGVGGGVS